MFVCRGCHRHLIDSAPGCPFCGTTVRTTTATGPMLVAMFAALGLVGVGCTDKDDEDGQETSTSGPQTTGEETGTSGGDTGTTGGDTGTGGGDTSTGTDTGTTTEGESSGGADYGGADYGGAEWDPDEVE